MAPMGSSSLSEALCELLQSRITAAVSKTPRDSLDAARERSRGELMSLLEHAVAGLTSITPYGSCVNTFAGPGSDVDLSLSVSGLLAGDAGSVLASVKSTIVSHPGSPFKYVKLILDATVPVLELEMLMPNSGGGSGGSQPVRVDITVNNPLPAFNSRLLRAYSNVDVCVRQLVIAVKEWANARRICDASEGTLSSYGWSLLVIFFLQQQGPWPCRPFKLPVLQSPEHMHAAATSAATARSLPRPAPRPPTMHETYDVSFCEDTAFALQV